MLNVEKLLVPPGVLRQLPNRMADRKLGCLSIFLFLALCASLFFNFVLMVAVFRRAAGDGFVDREPPPKFREITVERGRGNGRVALIVMRGLISCSLPGTVGETMVDDMRA